MSDVIHRYQTLILDFGGVVTTDYRGSVAAFLSRSGIAPEVFVKAMTGDTAFRANLSAAEAGRISQAAFEAALGEFLGIPCDGFVRTICEGLRPCQPVLDLVARARAAGRTTAVLSNSFGSGGYDMYAGYGLDALFDAVVISDRVGMRKPDEDIYRLTVKTLGVDPASCVFVDDTAENLPTAAALGMAVVHFTDVAAAVSDLEALLGLDCAA
jgi:epoxide hydrolase-like predicted phosphatase